MITDPGSSRIQGMAENNVFDKLVTELSTDERQKLLSRLRQETYIPDVAGQMDEDLEGQTEVQYGPPGLLERFVIFFLALFSGRPQHEVRENMVYKKAARDLERDHPEIVDFRQGVLLGGVKAALEDLAGAFSVFIEPVQQVTGGKKEEFYAFLGGLEMPDLQQEMQSALEPLHRSGISDMDEPATLKREIEFKIEDLLNTIETAEHDRMYMNARHIAWLRSMAFFPYGKILREFESGREGTAEICYINKVIKSLVELTDLTASYPSGRAETLYEALVTYRYREDIDKSDFEYEQKLKDFITSAGKAMEHFARFLKKIPLVRIIRIYRKDFSYYPRRTTGGEDWFLLYRQFWFNRLAAGFKVYMAKQELREAVEKALVFIRHTELPPEGLYRCDSWGYGTRVRYERTVAFINGWYRNVFLLEMNPVLKIVLIDGEFYKEQNRQEFTDAYNDILRLVEKVKTLDIELSEKGERGRHINAAAGELIPRPHRARKISTILQAVDKDVEEIIESILENLSLLEKVVRGIVYGEKGGRYDTLSNIGYLGKRSNVSFIVRLSALHKKIETSISILQSLYDIEKNAEVDL